MTRRESHKETATMNRRPSIAPTAVSPRLRSIRAALGLTCVLFVCLALAATPATAKLIHGFEGSFNGSETPSGSLGTYVVGIAVDNSGGSSAGDVYVASDEFGSLSVVSKFEPDGKYAGLQLNGAETPQGSFGFVNLSTFAASRGIAVDGSSGANKGDVYVADAEHDVIDRFSEAGKFLCQITGKTPVGSEEKEHECAGDTGSQTPQNGFTPGSGFSALGVAVDPVNGDIYVSDPGDTVIDEFNEKGEYIGQIAGSHIIHPASLAFDSTGELYVENGGLQGGENVVKFDASGTFVSEVDNHETDYVAVNPANNTVYTYRAGVEHQTAEYTAAGSLRLTFGMEQEAVFGSVGVSGSTGKVYVSSLGGGPVYMYSRLLAVPEVETGAAAEAKETSATVHGHVAPDVADGGGEITKCEFEYGPTKHYGLTAECSPGGPYGSAQDVTANLTELAHSTTYHYRVRAEDAEGAAEGEDKTFTTGGPPSIDRHAAEALRTSALLWAKIDPWGNDTTCEVQYVSDAAFKASKWASATTVPCSTEDLGSGFGDVVAKAKLTGLARATPYHYRFMATNQAGFSGQEGTFETFGIRRLSFEVLKGSQETEAFGGGVDWSAPELESPIQAGGHPYEVVTTIEFSHTSIVHKCEVELTCPTGQRGEEVVEGNETEQNVKDFKLELPPGLLGNPTALPKCSHYLALIQDCPTNALVGELEYLTDDPLRQPDGFEAPDNAIEGGCGTYCLLPLYNLEPGGAYPAEFGSEGGLPHLLPFDVRSGADYGITSDTVRILAASPIRFLRVRFWGVPANPGHEASRNGGGGCPGSGPITCHPTEPEVALLRNPTSCTGRQTMTARADTWAEPGQFVTKTTELEAVSGCEKLKFEPSLEAQPTTSVADSPAGLDMDLHVPQDVNKEGREEPGSLATADLRDAKVVLPAGMTVNPSSADGLDACSEAQVGYLPQRSAEVGHPQFTPGAAECPDGSQIGKVEVDSRLVDHPLPGAVYIAAQGANPFKSLLALYVTVYDAQTGLVVKLPGKVTADPLTGQLTATFDESPQLPFEDFKLDLFSGSRATLTTPLVCGSYSVSTDLTPWSAPEGADAEPSSLPFTVASAPGGGSCVSSEAQAPNTPGFEAGTASPIAASYSPFVLHLKREDGSQRFSGLNVTLPPGLIGKIAGLAQCPQAAIEAARERSHEGEGASELEHPSCPAGSEVGSVHVGAGSGAPYYVTGRAYFAGPYNGAPFSLVIVTPAVAGPFDLGTVVVRAGLYIDPSTTQVTVKSDPFPTILDGIPLDIRSVDVEANRKEFTLNPTSCNVMSVTGQESSTAGQTAALSDRFQAGGCTTLPFHPSFSASASGVTSRKEGASLVVNVASSVGQANIAKVHVSLPKQLPSRLETLKLACLERVFAANPASCPEGSMVGTAVAHTPILSSPLVGPAYIVSHGGAAFPDLEVVLQGEGVTIVLDGKTDITNGITSSSFESVPDAPISSFELKLPEGPHSILGAPGGLCSTHTVLVKKKVTVKVRLHGHVRKRRVTRTVPTLVATGLAMPTTITAQNGAVINQNTPIDVTGCPAVSAKHKTNSHAKPKKHKAAKKKHGK